MKKKASRSKAPPPALPTSEYDRPVFSKPITPAERIFSRNVHSVTPGDVQPVFSRQLSSAEPVFSRNVPADFPSEFQEGEAGADFRIASNVPVFSQIIPADTPVFSRSVPPPRPGTGTPIFSRHIPNLLETPASAAESSKDGNQHGGSGIPSTTSTELNKAEKVPAEIPQQSNLKKKMQISVYDQLHTLTEPRKNPGLPMEYPANILHFVSPYVADHIITDDAFMPGSKIFYPPRHAQKVDVRQTGISPERPVTFIGRETSPPLELNEMDLDSLSLTKGNFDPPKRFDYTKEQMEIMHDRVQSKDINWNDYTERLEVLICANRAALQMLMKIGGDLTQYQQDSQEIRDLLEGALEELPR